MNTFIEQLHSELRTRYPQFNWTHTKCVIKTFLLNTGTNQYDLIQFHVYPTTIMIQLPIDSGTNIEYTQQDSMDVIIDRLVEGLGCFRATKDKPLYVM